MNPDKMEVKPQSFGFPSKIAGMQIKTTSWKDFPGKPPENTWFLAYTYWINNYSTLTAKDGKRNQVFPTVSIGPKAWVRAKEDYPLLVHETGHYWIACLCALQFKKRAQYSQPMPQGMSFAEWCKTVQRKTSSQFAAMQKLYDKQTYHYCIQEEQKRWQKKIAGLFNEYDIYFKQKEREDRVEAQKAETKRLIQERSKKTMGKNRRFVSTPHRVTNKNSDLPKNTNFREVGFKKTNSIAKQPQNSFKVRQIGNNLGQASFTKARQTVLNKASEYQNLSKGSPN